MKLTKLACCLACCLNVGRSPFFFLQVPALDEAAAAALCGVLASGADFGGLRAAATVSAVGDEFGLPDVAFNDIKANLFAAYVASLLEVHMEIATQGRASF